MNAPTVDLKDTTEYQGRYSTEASDLGWESFPAMVIFLGNTLTGMSDRDAEGELRAYKYYDARGDLVLTVFND